MVSCGQGLGNHGPDEFVDNDEVGHRAAQTDFIMGEIIAPNEGPIWAGRDF